MDILSGLILDKNNKEMLSIFVRLYPHQTVNEVMKTEFAVLVKQALFEVIEENFAETSKGMD